MVPEEGVEPTQSKAPADFESAASASSATPGLLETYHSSRKTRNPTRICGRVKPLCPQYCYVDGFFRISANACSRAESAGLFAAVALSSNDGAMLFNLASLPLLICELSAL